MTFAKTLTSNLQLPVDSEDRYLHYWQLWHHNWDDEDIELIRSSIELGDKHVLEVGCGDGRVAFGLSKHCQRLAAIDNDNRFIKIARNRLAQNYTENLHFLTMDAQQLAFDDDSFDVAILPWVLQMVPDPDLAMQEIFRVLKERGQAMVIALRSDADYDTIISRFVSDIGSINVDKKYVVPIEKQFGKSVSVAEKVFYYYFESLEIAFDAFSFAIVHWYKTQMSDEQNAQLLSFLQNYEHEGRIRIAFPANIYSMTKHAGVVKS